MTAMLDPAPDAAKALDSDVEGRLRSLHALPLFAAMEQSAFLALMTEARIVRHARGATFLLQGEPVTHGMVLLEGWAKISKSTPEGDEAVLHMLGQSECLMETDIMRDGPSPVSARAMTPVTLLTIPASIMRDHVRRDKDLALAMLAASTRRAQGYIGHIEQVTVRSAVQRVGWFLLNTRLRAGAAPDASIRLPFDKALIAAWLSIKPETLSRVFKSFRKNGFRIDRQTVTPPHARALCPHCDIDLAQSCPHADKNHCPRPELWHTA